MGRVYFFSIFFLMINSSFSQIKYDDGPIGVGANFVTTTPWNKKNLTYFFQNGTNDIEANNEKNAIKDAFQIWATHAPLTFTEVSNSTNADIIILWGGRDHGDGYPFTEFVLAHAFYPPPAGGSLAGDIHFDDDEIWTLNERIGGEQPIDLVTVAAHEIGHALGLQHSNVSCALMNPYYFGSHRFLENDDIAGIQNLYGSKEGYIISGPTIVCSSGSLYQINNLPSGVSVSWSVSGAIAISGSSTGSSVTIVPLPTGGQPIIYATINTGCGSLSISKTVNKHPIPTLQTAPNLYDCNNMTVTATANGIGTFDWETTGGLLINGLPSPQYGLPGTVTITSDTGQPGTIRARSSNSCGVSSYNEICFTPCNGNVGAYQGGYLNPLSGEPIYIQLNENPQISSYYWYDDQTLIDITYSPFLHTYNWQCGDHAISVVGLTDCGYTYTDTYYYWGMCRGGYYFSAYPNPANDYIIISQEKNNISINPTAHKRLKSFTYILYDDKGKKQYSGKSAGEDVKIDIRSLQKGPYFLHIRTDNNNKLEKQQIIIQH